MKLVREHINERFTEEGDAVRDMGIGVGGLIKEYKKKVAKMHGWSSRDQVNDITAASQMVNEIGASGWRETALSDEDYKTYMLMLEHLLKGGVDVNGSGTGFLSNALNIKHPTPRRLEVLKLLLKYGLKIKTLDYLMSHNDDKSKTEAFKLLGEAGLKQRPKEKVAQTFKNNMLKWACEFKNDELTKWALDKGADPSMKNHYALQSALIYNNVELIKLFVKELLKEPEYK